MITLHSTAGPELVRLNEALGRVEALGKRSAAELVRRAAADILLGSRGTGSGSGAFEGLFGEFRGIAPEEGKATAEAEGRGWRVGTGSTSFSRGLAKARAVLGDEPSGAFEVRRGSGGRVFTPKRVYVRTRGKQRGTLTTRGSKTTIAALGRQSGYSTLNLRALAVAYAIAYRESARGATAAQFLPKRYRRELLRRDYEKAQQEAQRSINIPIQNKKGTRIGMLDLNLRRDGGYARILGELGVPDRFEGIVGKVITAVTADREAYLINQAMKKEIAKR